VLLTANASTELAVQQLVLTGSKKASLHKRFLVLPAKTRPRRVKFGARESRDPASRVRLYNLESHSICNDDLARLINGNLHACTQSLSSSPFLFFDHLLLNVRQER
jgi:hypothetical protein